MIEGSPIKKGTELQSNQPQQADIRNNGSHIHLHLRGTGPGGSRTAQSAMYPVEFCDDILNEVPPDQQPDPKGEYSDHSCSHFDVVSKKVVFIQGALEHLKEVATKRGHLHVWTRLVDPWLNEHKPSLMKAMTVKLVIRMQSVQ